MVTITWNMWHNEWVVSWLLAEKWQQELSWAMRDKDIRAAIEKITAWDYLWQEDISEWNTMMQLREWYNSFANRLGIDASSFEVNGFSLKVYIPNYGTLTFLKDDNGVVNMNNQFSIEDIEALLVFLGGRICSHNTITHQNYYDSGIEAYAFLTSVCWLKAGDVIKSKSGYLKHRFVLKIVYLGVRTSSVEDS